MTTITLPQLYQKLAYRFTDPSLLYTALTHRSAGMPNNERLEFLGDSILGYLVAEYLFERFPNAKEGELTRLRSSLVKGETLAGIARDLELGGLLRLGEGEMKSGGWRRSSILADALEALIAAVYLDGGMDACKTMLLKLFEPRFQQLSLKNLNKDAKTRLQEYLQAKKKPLPEYNLEQVEELSNNEQCFHVHCTVAGLKQIIKGQGNSRRRAEQHAAAQALEQLIALKQQTGKYS
ncbi:ribonuclease III [Candidatus Venteria ishoeyi]|uniref:Ribonuclease 3 n=1 Tax=Candidatus Venteria ishoeyi TaxID=1899563 RepID=A0A1H6F2F3_9GAMM|nr:ribonuclease III [Candidatus Venteria ishoeyi]MDM8548211.1 ribonuclease III [Candidatus Venteria ishoeyi]SEH04337.1 Ribonuclease 3 [Candidatus Venteria ishoeyi]